LGGMSRYSTRGILTRLSTIDEKLRQRYMIDAEDFNYLAERLVTNVPLEVKSIRGGGWRHPWYTSVGWDNRDEVFKAEIKPGYVNAEDVEVRIPAKDAKQETLDRLGIKAATDKTEPVVAELHEKPKIEILSRNLRKIGSDADPTGFKGNVDLSGGSFTFEPVPAYFADKGVESATPRDASFSGGIQEQFQVGGIPKSERRYLRAMDIVLTQERPASRAVWSDDPSTGRPTFSMTYTGSFGPDNNRVFISKRKKFVPQAEGFDPFQAVRGNGGTDPFDEIHVCTIYFLSQAGQGEGEDPDDSWTPYVEHHLFWNLNHGSNRLENQKFGDPVTFNIPLAGGIGTTLINNTLAENNARVQELENILNASQVTGKFWTT